ncbi:MAG: Na+/H+ antiporter NhaA [Gemmatimonadaceae bacterium]
MAPFQEFASTGALGGVALLITTVIALVWANSPAADSYQALWERRVSLGWAEAPFSLSLHHWINDGLMAVFFLLVGLEIKRELLVGELAAPRLAALPIAAAVGGMLVPAGLYAALNAGTPAVRGWGIPMATDIAFALGVLALLGPRVPVGLKVFLAALAIVDDLGAVLVIALFYTSNLDVTALLGAAASLGILVTLNRRRVTALGPYLLVGIALWALVLRSGIHATIAGVLLALTIPSGTRLDARQFSVRSRSILDDFDRAETGDGRVITSRGQQEALYALDLAASQANVPLLRLEHALHGLVAYAIMPLFALANAGVSLGGAGGALRSPVTWGIILGLLVGKFAGISLFSWSAVRLGLATLPGGTTWRHLRGVALLGGIGFTMSLFIAGLGLHDPQLQEQAKFGILFASTGAGVAGFVILRRDVPSDSLSGVAAGEARPSDA